MRITSSKEPSGWFFGKSAALERRLDRLESSVMDQIKSIEEKRIEWLNENEKVQLKCANDILHLQEQHESQQEISDQFMDANKQAHAKISDDMKFLIRFYAEYLRSKIQVLKDDLIPELKKLEGTLGFSPFFAFFSDFKTLQQKNMGQKSLIWIVAPLRICGGAGGT